MTSVEKKRTHWLTNIFAGKQYCLKLGRIHQVPTEIWRMIGSYMIQETACTLLRALWIQSAEPRWRNNIKAEDTSTLWIKCIYIEGRQYVKSLSTEWSGGSVKLFDFRGREGNNKNVNIFVASDRLGVRRIIIRPVGEMPAVEPEPGVGWNIYRRLELPLVFDRYFDVSIKLTAQRMYANCFATGTQASIA
jgi:hypothetical protein